MTEFDDTDARIRARIRRRRLARVVTQTRLARALGLSYQQVQKYETGKNRVGGGRLAGIAGLLDVPVAYFFDDAERPAPLPEGKEEAAPWDERRRPAGRSLDCIIPVCRPPCARKMRLSAKWAAA